MKRFFLITTAVLLQQIVSAQIPNAGMELWDNQPVLMQWETNSRPLTLPAYNPYIVVKDTDRYSGSFSANLIGNGVFHSRATTTFAIAQHPVSLKLHYKLNFPPCVNDSGNVEKDTTSVLVEILHNSSVVDSGYWQSPATSNSVWSLLTIPVSNNASVFDSCRITLIGGKVFGGCGFAAASTEFKVDALSLDYQPSCTTTGVIVQGTSCLLIDVGTPNWLMPCNFSLSALGFHVNDTIRFSYSITNCFSICQQGLYVDITCIDTDQVQPVCSLSVSLQKRNPTSYIATNGWLKANVSNGTSPYYYVWNNGVNGANADTIGPLPEGLYCVTVSDAHNCTATACDSLAGPHICIDSALICPGGPSSLCCDVPIVDPVCGCDSVDYMNGCIATYIHGVTSYYHGNCVITGIGNISEVQNRISVWPVPASDKLKIAYQLNRPGSTEIQVTNSLGQKLSRFLKGPETPGRYTSELDLSGFTAGIYFVEIKTESERKIKMFVME